MRIEPIEQVFDPNHLVLLSNMGTLRPWSLNPSFTKLRCLKRTEKSGHFR